MLTFLRIFTVISVLIILAACSKDEGVGGKATIKGTLIAQELNNSGQVTAEYPFPDQRVFIVYGDNDFYGDDLRTHFNGNFEFEFLRAGSYTVYAYSDCNTCLAGKEAIMIDTVIMDNNEIVELGNLVVRN
jgi:hypothetical protein